MNVFEIRHRLVADYASYIRSFINIRDKTLQHYPQVVATPTRVMVINDGDALFDRHPEIERNDQIFVTRMIVNAGDGQMAIACVVNAIVWFNALWPWGKDHSPAQRDGAAPSSPSCHPLPGSVTFSCARVGIPASIDR